MRLESIIYAGLFAGLFFTGLITLFVGVAEHYDVSYDVSQFYTFSNSTDIQKDLNKINDTATLITDINNEYGNTTLTQGGEYPQYKFWNIFSIIKNSGSMLRDMTMAISSLLGIPTVIWYVLSAVLLFTILISIIYLVTGK